jgi:hypothetical protein
MEFQNDLTGTWKIIWTSGGMVPQTIQTNFSLLQIKKNNHYFIYSNDTLKASGDYSIFKAGYNPYLKKQTFEVQFNNGIDQGLQVIFPFNEKLSTEFISNDTLVFSQTCPDCSQFAFAKL